MNRTTRQVLVVAAIGAFGAGFSWLYQQTHVIPAEQRANVHATELRILQIESELRRTTLEARYGLVNQYDGLAKSTAQLDEAVAAWGQDLHSLLGTAAAIDEPLDRPLDQALATLTKLVRQQRGDLESFKSHNSILKNSLRYLPLAVLELREAIAQQPRFIETQRRADAVLFRVFMLSSFRERSYKKPLHDALDALQSQIAELKAAPQEAADTNDRAQLVWLHGGVCAEEIGRAEDFLSKLRDRPINESVERVAAAMSKRLAGIEQKAGVFRALLYGLSGVFGLALLFVGYRLRRLYATLEQKVEERTAALSSAHANLSQLYDSNRLVLDNVSEGLVTLGLDDSVSSEMSSAARQWFGEPKVGEPATEWLGRSDAEFAASLSLGFEAIHEDFMPIELTLAQLPAKLTLNERSLRVTYRRIDRDGALVQLLLVAEDITEQLAQEQEEARSRQVVTLARRLAQDRVGTIEFMHETDALLIELHEDRNVASAKRHLHTLKGNTAIFDLDVFASQCHAVEDRIEEEARLPLMSEIEELAEAWSDLRGAVAPFLKDSEEAEPSVELRPADLQLLQDALARRVPHKDLEKLVEWWSLEPLTARFERMAQQMCGIARRLGREEPAIEVSGDALRTDSTTWRKFWAASVHVLRNIIDHGIEPADDRRAADKDPNGQVVISANVEDSDLLIRFADDGRGVDWKKVKERAGALGLPTESEADLADALFADRLSTRDSITETSGRGVGMSAVREACEALGGRAQVWSKPGAGMEIAFTFPADLAEECALAVAADGVHGQPA